MTRAQETMVRAVTDALRGAGTRVRTDGWPAELIVDYVAERDTYAVSLREETEKAMKEMQEAMA